MKKFFIRLFLSILIIIFSALVYLSYFGLETNRFDNLIKNKANNINQNVKLGFENTKIYLNLTELNLIIKLKDPKILVKDKIQHQFEKENILKEIRQKEEDRHQKIIIAGIGTGILGVALIRKVTTTPIHFLKSY